MTWTLSIGRDPALAPTDANPGHDVSHWFELQPGAVVLDGPLRPLLVPTGTVHAELGHERPPCFGPNCTIGLGAVQRLWSCSSTRRGTRRLSTAPVATTPTGVRP